MAMAGVKVTLDKLTLKEWEELTVLKKAMEEGELDTGTCSCTVCRWEGPPRVNMEDQGDNI